MVSYILYTHRLTPAYIHGGRHGVLYTVHRLTPACIHGGHHGVLYTVHTQTDPSLYTWWSSWCLIYCTQTDPSLYTWRSSWCLIYCTHRLTPAYMLVIMVYVCLTPYWMEGPFWQDTVADRDNCKTSWWTNILYINNLVKPEKLVGRTVTLLLVIMMLIMMLVEI